MPAVSAEKATLSGAKIALTDDLSSSAPMMIMIMDTISPATYSMRPCPKGCVGSARLPERRKPMSVITDEPASDRLLKASATTAMEPLRTPAMSLSENKSILSATPSAPAAVPQASRDAGSPLLSYALIRRASHNDSIKS